MQTATGSIVSIKIIIAQNANILPRISFAKLIFYFIKMPVYNVAFAQEHNSF